MTWIIAGVVALAIAVTVLVVAVRKPDAPSRPTEFLPPTVGYSVTLDDGGARIAPEPKLLSKSETAQYMCSKCLRVVSQEHVHVIPWFNDTLGDYVTTFRCDDDWQASLSETRVRFLAHLDDADERSRFVAFFARHGIDGLDADDRERLQRDGSALLDQIARRQVVLSP
jgi:hypothetical protein